MILSGIIDPAGLNALTPSMPEIWDVDLEETSNTTIAALHQLGKKVICYFSAGSSEDWRSDYSSFLDADKGGCLDTWPGEKWLDVRTDNVFQIMKRRIALAAEKGCDGVDPDNMDAWANNPNGVTPTLTAEDAKTYLRKLSTEAHSYGMAIGLKNSQGILNDVRGDIEFAVNEECATYDECAAYQTLLSENGGKPVFHVEYAKYSVGDNRKVVLRGDSSKLRGKSSDELKSQFCLGSNSGSSTTFSTVIKQKALDGFVLYCDDTWTVTQVIPEPMKGRTDCPASGALEEQ